MSLDSYRDLIAWQKAIDLAEAVYRLSQSFPKDELYSLTNQVRRAAVSISANIAEGQGRQTTRDFLHFLGVARGSLNEVESHLAIAVRLSYITPEAEQSLLEKSNELGRILRGLSKSLASKLDS